MKKLPLIFIIFFLSCSAPKQVVVITNNDFSKYQQPYHVFAIGQWSSGYVVLTLADAQNDYFTIKTAYNSSIKKGDVYNP
jgi:hypothetical protein